MRLASVLVIVAGLAAFSAGLVALVGPAGLIVGGSLLVAFGAVGIKVEDEDE